MDSILAWIRKLFYTIDEMPIGTVVYTTQVEQIKSKVDEYNKTNEDILKQLV